MTTTIENELRTMIGDLFMQIAAMRTELVNLREAAPEAPKDSRQPNSKRHVDANSFAAAT